MRQFTELGLWYTLTLQMFLRKKAWEAAAKCEQLPSDERLHLPSFSFSICEMRIMKATLSQSCFLNK